MTGSPRHRALQRWLFERPKDFDPEAYLSGAFGVWTGGDGDPGAEHVNKAHHVRIRFTGTAARHAREARWHASQKQEPQSDGSLVVTFELSDLTEVKSWILSYGASAEALAPRQLREQIAAELQAMHARYEKTAEPNAG